MRALSDCCDGPPPCPDADCPMRGDGRGDCPAMGDCTDGNGLPTDPAGLAGEGAMNPGLGVGCGAGEGCRREGGLCSWLPGLCGLAGVSGLLGGVCGVWNLRPEADMDPAAAAGSESECGCITGLGGLSSSVCDWRRWKAASSTYFMRNDLMP